MRQAFLRPAFQFKNAIHGISTLRLLSCAFGILSFLSVLLASILFLSAGRSVINDILSKATSQAEQTTQNEVEHFLKAPDMLLQYVLQSIDNEYVDAKDIMSFQRLLWNTPGRGNMIAFSSIYYANMNGELLGFGSRNLDWPLVDWTFSLASTETDRNYTIVDPTIDGMLSDKRVQLSEYDARNRSWFKAAIENNGKPVWGELYNDFESDKLTLVRAQASLDAQGKVQGVVGVDMHIRHLQNFLVNIPLNENGEVFIVDSTGLLIAANAPTLDTTVRSLVKILEYQQLRYSRLAARFIIDELGGFSQIYSPHRRTLTLDGEKGELYLAPIGREYDLQWTLGVFLPESDYISSIEDHAKRVGSMLLLIVVTGCAVITGFIYLVVNPIKQLRNNAALIANGQFEIIVDTEMQNEVGDLGRSFDYMRHQLQRSFAEMNEQKHLAQTTLDSIADGILAIDADKKITYINPVACRLLNLSGNEAVGKPINSLCNVSEVSSGTTLSCEFIFKKLNDEHKYSQEVLLSNSNEVSLPVLCRLSALVSQQGERKGLVAILSDLTEEHRLKNELLYQSKYDHLTKLINRQEFERCLHQAISSIKDTTVTHALCFIDLDQFKLINDTSGHDAGDELLRQFSRIVEEFTGENDNIGRLGGDEFGILIKDCLLSDAEHTIESLRSRLADFRFFWHNRSYQISLSAGLVNIDRNTGSVVSVMRDVDSACYVAKETGKNCVHTAHPDSQSLISRRAEIETLAQVKNAMERNLFVLYIQFIEPTAVPDINSPLHVEILLRMRSETGQLIRPNNFLPIAEKFGLSSAIDRWVIKQSLKWISENVSLMILPVKFSINISGQSLSEPDFFEFVTGVLNNFNIPKNTLCFEITETSAIADMGSALKLLNQLRNLGCKIALDDFGSGLCSFAYLKRLPVDYLKIDGQFIVDILDDPINIAMVKSINEIGQSLGILTIAEFVDSIATRKKLEKLGVDFVQGNLFGEPYPLHDLRAGELAVRSTSRRQFYA